MNRDMLNLVDRPPRAESRSSNVTLTTCHAAFSVGTVIVQRERNILLVYIKLIFIQERYAHSTLCVCVCARSTVDALISLSFVAPAYTALAHTKPQSSMIPSWVFLYYNAAAVCGLEAQLPRQARYRAQ